MQPLLYAMNVSFLDCFCYSRDDRRTVLVRQCGFSDKGEKLWYLWNWETCCDRRGRY